MVRREIEIDEHTDRVLSELASEYEGGLGSALADFVQSYEALEGLAGRTENEQVKILRTLRDRSEADFRSGRVVGWGEVKTRNGL